MAGAIFGAGHFSWQLVKLQSSCTLSFHGRCNIWCRSLFGAGAVLGELSTQVSQSCLLAGAVLGEVAVSLVMAGAAFGEICINVYFLWSSRKVSSVVERIAD